MRIDWACAPFAVRLPPPQVLRLTTAMRMSCFGGIVGGLDVRTVEEHKEVEVLRTRVRLGGGSALRRCRATDAITCLRTNALFPARS